MKDCVHLKEETGIQSMKGRKQRYVKVQLAAVREQKKGRLNES